MAAALAWTRIKLIVIVHDADSHPGERAPLLMWLQRRLARRADALVALSTHVAERLRAQGLAAPGKPVFAFRHPPMSFGAVPPPPFAHGGPTRLLFFGRLLAYKGLDLLSEALTMLRDLPIEVRIVGSGPESDALAALRGQPCVTVKNRWVAEEEIAGVIAWADILVLPYREASQSGAAAVAIAAGRWIVATRVGGLTEQLADENLAILCEPDSAGLATILRELCMNRPFTSSKTTEPGGVWLDLATALLTCSRSEIVRR